MSRLVQTTGGGFHRCYGADDRLIYQRIGRLLYGFGFSVAHFPHAVAADPAGAVAVWRRPWGNVAIGGIAHGGDGVAGAVFSAE